MKILLAALLAATPLAAATPAFSPDRIKAHVAFLADDLLEGRGTGTRGHEIAAAYVAAQFAAFGLTPGAKDGSWYQQVRLQEQKPGATPAQVVLTGPNGVKTYAQGSDVLVAVNRRDAVTDVEGEVVFAGYGLDAPAQGFNDYAGLDVRGKIVAVLSGAPADRPDEIAAHLQNRNVKAAAAAARGAIGLINLPTAASERRSGAWSKSVTASAIPSMTYVGADGLASDAAPSLKANATFNRAAADALFTGSPQAYATIYAEAGTPKARPKSFTLPTRVRITATAAFRTVTSPNVIGILPGSDPRLKAEVVVLMGHLDHLGIGPEIKGDRIYNGALDNAAGIATMLEVARAFAAGPSPRRTMMFVANTAEEKGLLGAEVLANDPPMPIGNFAAVVDLDQPMLLYDFSDVIAFGGDHSTMGVAIARGAAKAGVELAPDPMPEQAIFTRSDHYTFVKRGVPAVLLATGHGNGGKAAWDNYLSTDYHQPSDDMKLPINWAAGAKYAKVNFLIAKELADAPVRPRWYSGDYFGATFAPGAPTISRKGR